MVTFSTAQPQTVEYKVVHQNERRIRVCIPRLAVDGKYAQRLRCLVESIDCINDVRLNIAASWLGYLLFAEVPDLWIWVGGLLIFVGSIYAAYTENAATPESTEAVASAN